MGLSSAVVLLPGRCWAVPEQETSGWQAVAQHERGPEVSGMRLTQEGVSCPCLEMSMEGLITEAGGPIREGEEGRVV